MILKKVLIIPIIIASFSLASCDKENSIWYQRRITGTKIWDQYLDNDEAISLAQSGVTLDEYKDIVFTRTSYDYSLEANGERLFGGVFSFYAADFNNDGYRELCLGVSVGSGIIDERIMIYDYHNDKVIFSLDDRLNHDYYLTLNNDQLYAKETKPMKPEKQTRYGGFCVNNEGKISIDWHESTDVDYNLVVNDKDNLLLEAPHLLNSEPQENFKAGDIIFFKTKILNDNTDYTVLLNGTLLRGNTSSREYVEYSFAMPSIDSVLDIEKVPLESPPDHTFSYYSFNDIFPWVDLITKDTLKQIIIVYGYIGVDPETANPEIKYSDDQRDIDYNVAILKRESILVEVANPEIDGGSYRLVTYVLKSGDEYSLLIENGRVVKQTDKSKQYFRFDETPTSLPDINYPSETVDD